jgi:hypothetical protein
VCRSPTGTPASARPRLLLRRGSWLLALAAVAVAAGSMPSVRQRSGNPGAWGPWALGWRWRSGAS